MKGKNLESADLPFGESVVGFCMESESFLDKLVFIEWVDSHSRNGWTNEGPEKEPLLCQSVGWLVHDGEKAKTIAAHMTCEATQQRAGEMTIPTCAIKRICLLRWVC